MSVEQGEVVRLPRMRQWSWQEMDFIEKRRVDGWTCSAIAKALGRSETAVQIRIGEMRRAGSPIVPRHRAGVKVGEYLHKEKTPAQAAVTGQAEPLERVERRCKKLQDYWTSRGFYTVRFWVENVGIHRGDSKPIYAIRSNLVGGLPPGGRRG